MKILAIGNALLDIMVRIPDESLICHFNLAKGGMTLLQRDTVQALQNAAQSYGTSCFSGGSAANTAYGLAHLGVLTGFLGCIGYDPLGDRFAADLIRCGIQPHLKRAHDETGHCMSIITPDAERTMATYIGAAGCLDAADLTPELLAPYDRIYLEGYLIGAAGLVERLALLSEQLHKEVMLDLAAYTVVEQHFEAFRRLIDRGCCSLVLANEDEAAAYARLSGLTAAGDRLYEELLKIWEERTGTAVIKLGGRGALVRSGGVTVRTDVFPAPHKVDTTGAGDLYASGFIYGLIRQYPPALCSRIGAIVAAHMIEHIGAKMSEDAWKQTLHDIETEVTAGAPDRQ